MDSDLVLVLGRADNDDLAVLIDYITDKGNGRIMLSSDVCRDLTQAKLDGTINVYERDLISKELCSFGGNSIMNIFRSGNGIPYKELLCDVADKVGANYNKENTCSVIEIAVLMKLLEKSFDQMNELEKEKLFNSLKTKNSSISWSGPITMASIQLIINAGGFSVYKMTAIIAQSVAKMMLGRGLAFGAMAPVMRAMSILSGPIGWILTGIWTTFDLASPAYRITVPCVVQIAYMRQKMQVNQSVLNQDVQSDSEVEDKSIVYRYCDQCGTSVAKSAKFCSNCGHKLL